MDWGAHAHLRVSPGALGVTMPVDEPVARRPEFDRLASSDSSVLIGDEDGLLDRGTFPQITHSEIIHSNNQNGQSQILGQDDLMAEVQQKLENTPYGVSIDWTKEVSRIHLRETRKLIGTLFRAFKKETGDSPETGAAKGVRDRLRRVTQSGVYQVFMALITIYGLFAPDIAGCAGIIPQFNKPLAAVNTVVFSLFLMELLLFCLVLHGYFLSLQFWTDIFACLSIIADTAIGAAIIQSNAGVAGRGSRLIRLVRFSSRSSRLVRVLHISRSNQVLRLIPRLQRLMERTTEELAFTLWYKRMRHLFQYMNKNSPSEMILTDYEADMFHTAMLCEFPEPTQIEQGASRSAEIKVLSKSLESQSATFGAVVSESLRNQTGPRAFQCCVDDIMSMKESCAIIEQAVTRLTLKICVVVMLLLLMLQLVDVNSTDLVKEQGLVQLDTMASDPAVPTSFICETIVNSYQASAAPSQLLFVALNKTILYTPTCRCCNPTIGRNSLNATTFEDVGVAVADAAPYELQELAFLTVGGNSFVIWDQHKMARYTSLLSLIYTIVVVLCLTSFILFFSVDIKKMSNNNALHPMWDIMDDMSALKSIELLVEYPERDAQEEADEQEKLSRHLLGKKLCKCTPCNRFSQPIPVAEELVQLRSAVSKLHQAMTSWSKFVPPSLLRQLLQAGVEAKIGCTKCEVSVLFTDVKGFKQLCAEKRPHDVIEEIAQVLECIHEALEEHGGTMLEFIGDEVLAIFNAPQRVPNPPKAAILAALQAIESTRKLGVYLQSAVHIANVLAGNIGSPTRMKYGVLGDGVNMTARLKSLNTRYSTQLLVSSEALEASKGELVYRTIGKLVLKGRTTPTHTFEVLGTTRSAPPSLQEAGEVLERAFNLFCARKFHEAKALFLDGSLKKWLGQGKKETADVEEALNKDRPSLLLAKLCDQFIAEPPPEGWDGSEHLNKKAW